MKSLGVRDDAAEAPADSSGAKTTAIAGLWLSAQRVLGLVAALITVPLAARSLGTEEFSVWLLIGTLGALTGVVDLGLANGLVTHVARASAVGDHTALRRLASSGWYALSALGVALALLLVPLVGLVDLRGGIGIGDTISQTVVAQSLVLFGLAICVGLPLSLASRVRQGRHEMKKVAFWGGVGAVGQLAVSVLCFVTAASLPWWTLASVSGPLIAGIGNTASLFLHSDPDLRPSLAFVKLSTVRLLGRSGWLFFVLGIAAAVGYQADALVISVRLGADRVPEYVLPFRLFIMIPTFLGFFVLPHWATHAEALQRGEAERVRRTLRISLFLSGAIATVASIILIFVSPAVIRLWAGPSVPTPSVGLLCSLALLAIALGLSGPVAMLLNGADVIGFQVTVASVMMVVNLALSIALVIPIGVAGPPLATALAQVFCVLVPCAVYTRRLFDRHRLPAEPVLQRPVVM